MNSSADALAGLLRDGSETANESMGHNETCISINVLMLQINDWTQYPAVRFLTFAAYALLFLIGMVGNIGIIGSILRRRDEAKVVANVFLLNLAFIDVLLCLIAVPITPITSIYKQWYFGEFLCKFVPMCQGMTVLITSISLVFIAVDRYRNIVNGTRSPWQFHHALGVVAASWAFAGAVNWPVFTSQVLSTLKDSQPPICGIYCMPQNWDSETVKRGYGSAMLCLQFILPSILLAYCYTEILVKVKKDMVVHAVAGASQQSQAAARKTRVMRVLMLMVAAFLLSWLPLSLLNILRDFDVDLGTTLYAQLFFFSNLFHWAAMTSVVWNPLLYFWLSKYRRREVSRSVSGFASSVKRGHGLHHHGPAPRGEDGKECLPLLTVSSAAGSRCPPSREGRANGIGAHSPSPS